MLYVNVLTRTGTFLTKVSASFEQELEGPRDICRKARSEGVSLPSRRLGIENYNLHPIVRSPKTDKCGPHEANGKKPFQPTRLLKPWGEGAPLSATYVAIEIKVLGLPTGVGTLIITI
jgi:hypothetical protein